MEHQSGKLIIVATPLGNLGDITVRSLEALKEADIVCAEDTRMALKLFSALGIASAAVRFERMDENTIGSRLDEVKAWVDGGASVIYCTDAGMPGVSDPGGRLVEAFRQEGRAVEVLPGPSAAVTAYVASGISNSRYLFGGFFPRKRTEQEALLEDVRFLDAALVFYESPRRLVATLDVIAAMYPYREVAVCRELTKLHEEVVQGRAEEVLSQFQERAQKGPIKGEIALVISGPTKDELRANKESAHVEAFALACRMSEEGAGHMEITRALMGHHGLSRNDAYGLALQARDGSDARS